MSFLFQAAVVALCLWFLPKFIFRRLGYYTSIIPIFILGFVAGILIGIFLEKFALVESPKTTRVVYALAKLVPWDRRRKMHYIEA